MDIEKPIFRDSAHRIGDYEEAPLIRAILQQNSKKVQRLANSASTNAHSMFSGNTPLIIAVLVGNVEIVKILLDKGADPNRQNTKSGNLPLMMLVNNANGYRIMDALVIKGADVNAINEVTGDTVLIQLTNRGSTFLLELLLVHGADPNKTNVKTGTFPLAVARAPRAVAVLVTNGAFINKQNAFTGNCALSSAIFNGNPGCARELVERGADINLENQKHQSPVYFAAQQFTQNKINCDLLVFFIQRQAKVQFLKRDKELLTLVIVRLTQSLPTRQIEELAQILTKMGANINIPGDNGNTLLHYFAKHNNLGMVTLLQSSGADPGARNSDNKLPEELTTDDRILQWFQTSRNLSAAELRRRNVALHKNPMGSAPNGISSLQYDVHALLQ